MHYELLSLSITSIPTGIVKLAADFFSTIALNDRYLLLIEKHFSYKVTTYNPYHLSSIEQL